MGAELVRRDPEWQAALADRLGEWTELYVHGGAYIPGEELMRCYYAALHRDTADAPPVEYGAVMAEAVKAVMRTWMAPERLRSDWVSWIAPMAMGGVIQPFVDRMEVPVISTRTRHLLYKAIDHPEHGLDARVSALFAKVPSVLADRLLRLLRPQDRTREELERFFSGAGLDPAWAES